MTSRVSTETNATNERLRAVARKHGLPSSGRKAQLREWVATIIDPDERDRTLVEHCLHISRSNCPVAIFEAGGVNLDGEFEDDLSQFWAWLGMSGSIPTARALLMFPGLDQRDAINAARSLKRYAPNKAAATACRRRGKIPEAKVYEDICERIYNEMPEAAKW